jgi:integrase
LLEKGVKQKITKTVATNASYPVPGRVIWDTELSGFGLKVTPTNTKTYIFQYRMGGRGARSRTLTIGRHGSPWTPETARKEAERHFISVRQGIDPQSEKLSAKEDAISLAFDKYVERFVTGCLEKRWPRFKDEGARLLRREAVPHFRATPLPSISKRDVTALFDKLADRPGIAKNTSTVLRRLFNWACQRGDLSASPMDRIVLPEGPGERDRFLDDSEIALVWRATLRLDHPYASLVRSLLLLGQRRDEVGEMTWDEVDLEKGVWFLPPERTKNGKPHSVPLSPAAITELKASPWRGGYVFSVSGDKPIANWSYWKRKLDTLIAKDAQKANVPLPAPWRLHDLRRTVGTGMQRLGEHTDVIEAFCNRQVREGVSGIYQRHDYEMEKRRAAERWSEHVTHVVTQSALA